MTGAAESRRILLVDDDDALRRVLREQLFEAGYRVTACADGNAALGELERSGFDAVLSDIRMPGLEGVGLLRAVRERDLDLPVVLLTGMPTLESAIQAVEWGALGYLIKPIAGAELLATMDRAIKLGALARLKREALIAAGFDQTSGDRAGLEASVTRAMGSLWIAYQPIVRSVDGAPFAHEALVRTRAAVFPHPGALFVAAERLGRLLELGRAIRGEVAAALASGALPGTAFVNLHPADLGDESLVDPEAPLSRFADRVVLEVTERASLDGIPDVSGRIAELRRLGYRIAVDDLGAGYAGLASLAALSPEIVKIDMALVRDVDLDPVKRKLITSIAGACRELGIAVVAEGVETEGELQVVGLAGCDLVQGFLIGRPTALAPP